MAPALAVERFLRTINVLLDVGNRIKYAEMCLALRCAKPDTMPRDPEASDTIDKQAKDETTVGYTLVKSKPAPQAQHDQIRHPQVQPQVSR